MYHDNRIAVFISHLYGEYQQQLCQGAVDKALEYGYRAEIYCSNDGEAMGEYVAGEDAILRIPDFSAIDGIVFAASTYVDGSLRSQIAETLRRQDLPVVEVAEYEQSFPSVSLRNCDMFQDMAEHLIWEHGARRICYLGYAPQSFFSDRREQIISRTAAAHGLSFGPEDVFVCGDDRAGYTAALRHFTAKGLPDAVMCYNDRVAVRFWEAAHREGYAIPRDFALTGCDDLEEGRNMEPPLTTITFPGREVGAAAVDALIDQMHGHVVPVTAVKAQLVLGGTCGCRRCHAADPFLYERSLSARIAQIESGLISSLGMSSELSRCTDIDAAMELLEKYVLQAKYHSDFYLCLYPGWDDPSDALRQLVGAPAGDRAREDGDILLKLAVREGKRLPECTFQKGRLLPDFIQRDSQAAFVISPLFFSSRLFGYLIRSFKDNRLDYRFHYVLWLTNIAQLLQNIYERKRLHAMSYRLESIYAKDPLTGLYNQHGFHARQETLLRSVEGGLLAAVMFDTDNLKRVNDQFGHQEGDFALRTVAQALRNAFRQEDLCARFEGDEFYVLVKTDDAERAEQCVRRVRSYLENFNKLSNKPYRISVSAGIAVQSAAGVTGQDVRDLFAQADAAMRRDKKDRPAAFLR